MGDAVRKAKAGEGNTEIGSLLNLVAEARDEARRLKLGLCSHLLDVVCLELSQMTGETGRPA